MVKVVQTIQEYSDESRTYKCEVFNDTSTSVCWVQRHKGIDGEQSEEDMLVHLIFELARMADREA